MALPFSLFLSLKYLKPKRTFLSVVTVISVLGVTLGVAVLVIVLSVMSGFDVMWREKILGFNAHVTVSGVTAMDSDPLVERLRELPEVRAAAPFIQGLVFLQSGETVLSPYLRGVDLEKERTVSRIPEHMVSGRFDIGRDQIILGRDLARQLRVETGDTVLLYSPRMLTSPEELHLPEEWTVGGIFELGMWDFDAGFALAGLHSARELFGIGQGMQGLQVMTDDPYRAAVSARAIEKELGPDYAVHTWMELNRQLFTALRVEKNMMFFLLIFITVVAAFGITNTLITVTVQKTREIGLLKSLGFSSASIMRVFFWQGWIAGIIGTGAGIGGGLLALRFRNELMRFLSNRFRMDLFPKELYHLEEIPAHTSFSDLATVIVAAMIICTLAGVIPAYRAARLDPAKALRYE